MYKFVYIVTGALLWCIAAKAQSIDERIANAMNTSDYFNLYDTYYNAPKDSINPFLETYSRCLIGNRFNRPDISIPAFEELFNNHPQNLDLNMLALYSMDLSRVGRNEEAYNILNEALKTVYPVPASLTVFADMAARYKALTKYSPYRISINGKRGIVPFDTIRAGKVESEQYLMQITDARINDREARITFDTGAGVNVITDSLANVYGLEFLDANATATGMAPSVGRYAIAKELTLGNITICDVPFYIIDISSHHEEADKYISAFELIVGGELMLQLKDVTIDFSSKKIIIQKDVAEPTDDRPNMCFSSGMNFMTTAKINQQPSSFLLDSGNASYGWLNTDFFETNKEYITANCQSDTINQAGVGGVHSTICYKLPDAIITIGGNSVKIPSIAVHTEPQNNYIPENNLGLKSMMLFRKIRFNLVDMIFSAEP